MFASTPPVTVPPRLCRTSTDRDRILSIPPVPFASITSCLVSTIWSVSGPGSTAITALITSCVELIAGIPPSTGVAESHAYRLSPAAFLSPGSSGEDIGAGVT